MINKRLAHVEGLPWNRYGDEVIVLGTEGDKVYMLNETAAEIWSLLDGKKTISQVVDAISVLYGIEAAEGAGDIRGAIQQLIQYELVEVVDPEN